MKHGVPNWYTAQQLQDWPDAYRADEGGYFPARPMGFQGLMLGTRLRYAWAVFTGQCDVLSWKESK